MEMLCASQILAELECPVCTDYMHPPIRQCLIGHSFCDKCYQRLDKCPTCRNPKGTARSYALENLHQKLSFPCKNQVNGCPITMLGTNIRKHEESCPFAPLICPLNVINDCLWRGDLNDVIQHCLKRHPTNVYITNIQQLTCKNFLKRDETIRRYYILFKAYDEIFKATLQINYDLNLMKWCVYHLASYSIESSANYTYEIIIENRNSSDNCNNKWNISLKSSCQPISIFKDSFSDEHCLLTHFDMIKKFCTDDDFIYTIKIHDRL